MSISKVLKKDILGILMCLCFAAAIAGVFLFGDFWKTAVQVFNISSELFCMAVTLVMYMWHLRHSENEDESNKIFSILCVLTYFALLFDMVFWTFQFKDNLYIVNLLAKIAVYILSFFQGAFFVSYILSFLNRNLDSYKKMAKALFIIMAVAFVIRLLCILLNQYFYIDDNGMLQNGPMFGMSLFIMPALCVFTCGAAAYEGCSARKVLCFLSYPLAILLRVGFAMINPDYANALVLGTIPLVFIYCSTFMEAEEQRAALNENLQRYLSEDVVNHLTSGEDVAMPGGRTVDVTLLFASIHHFGNIMESMEPEDAVEMLNHFLGTMSEIVANNHGTLLEFPGYGIFCMFGAFNRVERHGTMAVKAADQMQKKMAEINAWNKEHRYPEIGIGIGINSGETVLGNIGSADHMRFSAISRHVNLASRIQTYSHTGDIVMSQSALQASNNVTEVEMIKTIVPKGIADPINIYKVKEIIEV